MPSNFHNLQAWQEAMNLTEMVYQLTGLFPKEEIWGLAQQTRKSAVSIPSNIAEGCGRGSDIQFNYFLNIARGSAFELETQLLIAQRVQLAESSKLDSAVAQTRKVQRMVSGLMKSLQADK